MGKHRFLIDGRRFEVDVLSRAASGAEVSVNGKRYRVELDAESSPRVAPSNTVPPAARPSAGRKPAAAGEVRAPMAGLVLALHARVGEQVQAGDPLIVLDAMKMENTISAASSGVVSEIAVEVGATVQQGTLLVRLSPA